MPHLDEQEQEQKPGIFGGLLNQIFPAGSYGDLIDPAQVRDEQNLAFRRAGLSILAGAGPQPRGTRNIGASIAQALDPSPWQQRLTQVAQQAAAIKKMQAQADREAQVNAIIGKFSVDPNATPEQQENRYRQLVAAFTSAGLMEEAQAAAGLIKDVRPEAVVPNAAVDKTLSNERLMFGQYLQQTSKENDIALNYNSIINATDSAAGDVALIFSFMRILDPGSTVREGEFANAQNTGSIPQRIWAQYNRAVNGHRLTKDQRRDFINTAHDRVRGTKRALQSVIREYQRRAKANGLDPQSVIYDYFQSFEIPGAVGESPTKPDALTPYETLVPVPKE